MVTKVPVGVEGLRLAGTATAGGTPGGAAGGGARAQRCRIWGASAVQATFQDGSGLSSAAWGCDGTGSGCIKGLQAKVMPGAGTTSHFTGVQRVSTCTQTGSAGHTRPELDTGSTHTACHCLRWDKHRIVSSLCHRHPSRTL